MCFLCICVHVMGMKNPGEPMTHDLFFCGIFFGFWFYSMIQVWALCFGLAMNILIEAINSFFGGVFFLVAAALAMMNAEQDEHLMYLTDDEERTHPFFYYCKWQSIFSLITGFSFIRNFLLIMDILLIRDSEDGQDLDDEDREARLNAIPDPQAPLKLYDFIMPNRTAHGCMGNLFTLEKRTDRNIDRTI